MLPLNFAGLLQRALTNEMQWEPFHPGVEIVQLYREADGHAAALLRYTPGAGVPRHDHPGFEHILILSGSQVDDRGTHVTGTLLINPPGSSHQVSSPDGCIVLAIWEQPVRFHGSL
jgi:anti-sigma factor ChrR (cupin superfamily)